MVLDRECDINELARIYIINDFEPSEFEKELGHPKVAAIELYANEERITGYRIKGSGSRSFQKKAHKLF
jgi:hypothetical protein